MFDGLLGLVKIYACESVFNPNIPIFPPNPAEGLHFSAFHYRRQLVLINIASKYCSIAWKN